MDRLGLRNIRLKFKTAGIFTSHFKQIYRIYPDSIKENRRMSIYNRLALQTLESQPIMPKLLSDHWLHVNLLLNFTSHTRPSARDQYTSSTLIGGNGGAGPRSLKGSRWMQSRAQHFLQICTHTQTTPINIDLCPPMPTHSMTCVHPCSPMLFKLRPCIQEL